jgi:hypothetical protein
VEGIVKLKKFDIVEIDFLDSIENTDGWTPLKKFNFKDHYGSLAHRVTGYFVNQTKQAISVCQAHSVENGEMVVGVWSVPIGAITKIRKFK